MSKKPDLLNLRDITTEEERSGFGMKVVVAMGDKIDALTKENAKLREENALFRKRDVLAQMYVDMAKDNAGLRKIVEECRYYVVTGFGLARLQELLAKDAIAQAHNYSSLESHVCECGHARHQHSYQEGACRPGFVCEGKCTEFRASPSAEREEKS